MRTTKMINPKDIPAKARLKPLLDGLTDEIVILDAERQRSMAKIKVLLNELDEAVKDL